MRIPWKKLELISAITLTLFFLITYQNCSETKFNSKDSISEEYYSTYSNSDRELLKTANDQLKTANVSVRDFLTIIDAFSDLAKDSSVSNGFAETTQTDKFKLLETVAAVIGKLLGALNSIPTLNQTQRELLNSATANVRSLGQPKSDDRVLKALLLSIELKQVLLEAVAQSASFSTMTKQRQIETTLFYLSTVEKILDEILGDVLAARPSQKKELETFRSDFIGTLRGILTSNWSSAGSTENAQSELEPETIIDALTSTFTNALSAIEAYRQGHPSK